MRADPDALGPQKAFGEPGTHPTAPRSTPSIDPGLLSAVGGGSQLHELSITRFFDAPRERVYEAFTNPQHTGHWAGPRGFTAINVEQDARPGGKWRLSLHQTGDWKGGTYSDLGQGGVFKELVPPERLVYTFAWDAQSGLPTRETEITIRFTEVDANRTKMDFHQAFFDTVESRNGHNEGWNSSFDRLDDLLKEMLQHPSA